MAPRAAPVPTNNLVHALLYVRVSGAEHQREGLSLDFQEKATRAYAASQAWLIAGEYRDVDSGAHDDRRGYQALLAEARRLTRAGHRVAVVVVHLDRFGRDLAEGARARKALRKLGVEQHSIKEGGHRASGLHSSMLLVIGEHERELIADRVTDVRRSLVEAGWPYGRVAFGYRLRPATPDEVRNGVARKLAGGGAPRVFEPDLTTSGVAVGVFERVARGESVRSVSRWLASLPEGLRGGRAWPIQSVVDMLRSPTYIARPPLGAPDVLEREVARWQPLVSDDLWTRVQEQLAGHQRRPHQASGNYLLTGFVRCDRCGSRMGASTTGYWNKSADAPGRVYRCIGGSLGANAPVRDCKHAVSLPGVDKAALGQVGHVLDTLADPDRWPAFQRVWEALDKPTDDAARVDQLEHEIAALNKRLANAAALLADGVLDRDGYQALRERETAAIKDAEAELRRLAASRHTGARRLPSAQAVFDQVGSWAAALRGADVAVQREVLDVLVEQVVPHRVSQRVYTVDITWTPLGQALAQAGNV